MIEHIEHNHETLAIILRHDFDEPGIHFLTPNEYSQQLAYMHHPAGKIIPPHVHNPVNRSVINTLEVLFVKKGKLQIDFYTDKREYIESKVLDSGDVILLASGGHGFTALEDLEMVEVKQGPYAGEADKTRFEATDHKITIK